MLELILLRAAFVILVGAVAVLLRPFGLSSGYAALSGFVIAAIGILLERRLKATSLTRLLGALLGAVTGVVGALLVSLVLGQALSAQSGTIAFLQLSMLGVGFYLGVTVGAKKGELLNLSALGGIIGGDHANRKALNLVDTSVVIDGRIADIAETGFLDGTLAIPQFVLRELQMVADSADTLKRNRGRRGLDVLQRLQKLPQLNVQILDDDFPSIRDVDMKLVELGKQYRSKIVTNDFNLNKVAHLHGVEVLNINELANALKPVVLPGEIMRVFILKEGKEHNQGVAYWDDGTMIVVDNARRLIGKTIDITVTSVLQTTAGKMIFARFDDRMHMVYDQKGVGSSATTTTGSGTTTAPLTGGSHHSTGQHGAPGYPNGTQAHAAHHERAHHHTTPNPAQH